jgi:hypothetical protein
LSNGGLRVDLELFSLDGASFAETTLDTLHAFAGVARVSPSLRVAAGLVLDGPRSGTGTEPEDARLTLRGVEPRAFAELDHPQLANGTFLDRPDTIVLPMQVAIERGLNVGDVVTLHAVDGMQQEMLAPLAAPVSGGPVPPRDGAWSG